MSWWDGDGNANDIVYGNHGALQNGATFAAGKVGQAFSFDGVNDFVEVPDNTSLDPTEITIATWVNIASSPTTVGNIVSKGVNSGYRFRINNDRAVQVLDRGSTNMLYSTGLVPLNQWTHITVVGSSTGLRIYLNGILDASNSVAYGAPDTSGTLKIGAEPGFGEFFNGLIDEVQIYSRALSASEIQGIFNAGDAGLVKPTPLPAPSGLASWWPGDGNPDDIVGGYHGTLVSGTTFVPGKVGQAFSFDGVDDYVDLGTSVAQGVTALTYEAWINPDDVIVHDGLVVGRLLANQMFLSDDGHLYANRWSTDGSSSANSFDTNTVVPEGTWTHVAATFDDTTIKVYINGVEAGSKTYQWPLKDSTFPMLIGTDINNDRWFDGLIDEVTIYGRALTGAEIQAIFLAGSGGKIKPSVSLSSCGTLDLPGQTYVLADDLTTTGTCIAITANGITLDGQGHKITASNAIPAAAVTGRTGVSILNLDLSGNAVTGIKISGGSGNLVSGVDVSWDGVSHGGSGVQLESSNNNIIQNLTATNRSQAIYFTGTSGGNTIQNSNLSGSNYAIHSTGPGQGNSYLNNDLSGAATWAVFVYSDDSVQISGNDYTLASNAIFLNGVDGVTIDGENVAWTGLNLGGIGLQLENSNNNIIQNLTATRRSQAVYLTGISGGNIVRNNDLSGSNYPIHSTGSGQGNSFLNNDLSGAVTWGIFVYSDDSVQISGNDYTLVPNAIYLNGVDGVTIDGENLAWTGSGRAGIGLQLDGSSDNNTIRNLTVNKRTYGVLLTSGADNHISCASITSNLYGVLTQGTTTGVLVNQSIIQGNSTGILNQIAALVGAENNYWGATDGPLPTLGSGDSISGNVDADPFLLSAQEAHVACGRAGNTTTIDFEDAPGPDGKLGTVDDVPLAEFDLIDDEFASLGVTFSLVGPVEFTGAAAPIIATEGGTKAGFVGSSGNDSPTSSPVNSITPGLGPPSGCPCLKALRVDFASPVISVSIFVLDFDSTPGQELHMIAFDLSDNEIARGTITSLGFPSGDGAIQELSVSAPGIRWVKIDTDTINDNGIALDDLSFVF